MKCKNSTRANRITFDEIHSLVISLDLKWPCWTSTWPCFKNSNIYNENYFNEIPNQFVETFLNHFGIKNWMNQTFCSLACRMQQKCCLQRIIPLILYCLDLSCTACFMSRWVQLLNRQPCSAFCHVENYIADTCWYIQI